MKLFFALVGSCLSTLLFAQQPFDVESFPYTDVHIHTAIKPFNSRGVHSYNMWEQIDHKCQGKLSKVFVNGSSEVPRTSQCHLEGMVRGNVQLGYLSLTPLEKGMMDARLLNEKKKGAATMACVSGVESEGMVPKRQEINYYDDLAKNIEYVLEGQQQPYYIKSEAYQYTIPTSGQHLTEIMTNPYQIALILNIEGGHALGHSIEVNDVSDTKEFETFVLENVERIKGLKPLREGKEAYLKHPIMSMNLNHFFWNGLSGHARTFSNLQTFVFGAKKGVNEPMTALGKKVVKRLLDRSEGRRVVIDVKHMSLASRLWYYDYLQQLREKGDTVGIISSHSTVAGVSMHSKAFKQKDKKGKNKHSYLNLWTISLCDEDVQQIHASKGIIGIMLDKYRLVGEKGKKALKEAIPGSAESRKLYAKIIWANIFECIEAVGDKSAWDIIAIGSDFDGMIVPFESYPRSNEMPDLAKDLMAFLENPEDLFDLFTAEEVKTMMYGYAPKDILFKVMFQNGYQFAVRTLDQAQELPKLVEQD